MSFSFGASVPAAAATPAPAALAPTQAPQQAVATAAVAASPSTTPSATTGFGFGGASATPSAFGSSGASSASESMSGSGFARFAGLSTPFTPRFGGATGGGGLFGSTHNDVSSSGFGCSPSSGFSFASAPSGGTPFGLPSGYQAQATTGAQAIQNLRGFYVPDPASGASAYQVPPTFSTFGVPAVAPLVKKKKPVSSLVVDEDEGCVAFPSRDGAEFRYRLTLTKCDKIKVWLQDNACKYQWESKELDLSDIVSVENAIPMMELKDYFESFKSSLSVPPSLLFKEVHKCDLVTPVKQEKSDNEDIELQITLSMIIFSKVLSPTYSFPLHSVKMSEMDILNAKIHDQEDEIEQLRTQVDTLASKVAGTTFGFPAPATATGLFSSHSAPPQYLRAETTRVTNPDHSLAWKGCDNTTGMFGSIYQLQETGAIRFARDGLYCVQVVVHHTNTYAPNNVGVFGRASAERAAFFLQKNWQAIVSSFGSNPTGAIQSSPLYHILPMKAGEELRVVYYGTGVAKEGSYLIIHEVK